MVKVPLNSALVVADGTPLTPQFAGLLHVPEVAPAQVDSVESALADCTDKRTPAIVTATAADFIFIKEWRAQSFINSSIRFGSVERCGCIICSARRTS